MIRLLKKNLFRFVIFIVNIVSVEKSYVFFKLSYFLLRCVLRMDVSNSFFIDYGFDCLNPKKITIKNNVSLGNYNRLWAFDNITICEYVQTAIGLTVIAGSHNIGDYRALSEQSVVIGPGCWIGANVTIIGGVTIGKGSIIAAGAVVTNSIPEFAIAGGVPAKVLKQREPVDIILSPFGEYTLSDLLEINY